MAMRIRMSFPVGAVMVLLSSCAVGPNYQPPRPETEAPATFLAQDPGAAGEPVVADWWAALRAPVLDRLISEALASNADLAAAEARVQQSRALVRISGAQYYPTFNADGRVSRDKLSRNGENLALIPFEPPRTEFTDYRLGFDAVWEIDLAGKTRRDVEATVARLGSSEELRNDARSVLTAEVASAYVDYLAAMARLHVAEADRSRAAEVLELDALQVRAGTLSETDRRRVEAEARNAEAAVPPLAAARDAAMLQLVALTGTSRDAVAALLADATALPEAPQAAPVGLPGDVLRRRPDVRHAERELAAATADVGSAIAARFPRLTLVGDAGWDSVQPGKLVQSASRYWNIGPQLTVPIFSAGRLRAQSEAAASSRDAAEASYRAAVLRAVADAETGLVRLAADRERQRSVTASAQALAVAAQHEQLRYGAGEASRIEVLQAERALDAAEDGRIAEQAQVLKDYVSLGKSLGFGWQERVGAAVAARADAGRAGEPTLKAP